MPKSYWQQLTCVAVDILGRSLVDAGVLELFALRRPKRQPTLHANRF